MNEVWVFIEQSGGKIADVSLELLGKGCDLAKKLNVKVGALLLGSGVKALSEKLFQYGADTVYLSDNAELKDFRTLPYAFQVSKLIKENKPQIVLFGASTTGRRWPRSARAS
jgi:electron transfer flavoprotein alpha subunit